MTRHPGFKLPEKQAFMQIFLATIEARSAGSCGVSHESGSGNQVLDVMKCVMDGLVIELIDICARRGYHGAPRSQCGEVRP
jgi:hypothetical protein